jgi:hypothetical protein
LADEPKRARVYIDGFNFYYAAFVEGHFREYKWLDLVQFAKYLVPSLSIDHVRYFTAKVKPTPKDPANHIRQGAYLNALRTLPRLSIHLGSFSHHEVPMHLVTAPSDPDPAIAYRTQGGPTRALVHKNEEKGSDVNLASYLLRDAFKDLYDVAVVVSDDSDLFVPVHMVQAELHRQVIVARVPRYSRSGARRQIRASVFEGKVSFIRDVRRYHFAASQMPARIETRDGRVILKPPEWDRPPVSEIDAATET